MATNRTNVRWTAAVAATVVVVVVALVLRSSGPSRGTADVIVPERTRAQRSPAVASGETLASLSRRLRSHTEKSGLAPSSSAPGPVAPAVPGQLIITYPRGSSAVDRAAVRAALDVELVSALAPLPSELVSFSNRSLASLESAADAHPAVQYAEPNFIYRATDTTPNDPAFKDLWGLENTAQSILGTIGVADADIDAAQAWDASKGAQTAAVGVVDSGVDANHVDLALNIWVNPGEAGEGRDSNGIDDDNNGYVDDWRGWDWIDDDNDGSDLHGHGTHVAGTIGARGGDGVGITGINWRVGLVPLRVLGADGSGTSAGISAAFAYAGQMGIPVVNASLGGPGFSQTLSDTIARYPNTLYVVAAGNDGTNNESRAQYPCNYTAPNLICVASTTNSDQLSSFSNYGSTSVDIAAPGSGILSTVPAFTEPFLDTFETDLTGRWSGNGTWGRAQDAYGFFIADSPGSGYDGRSDSHLSTDTPTDLSRGTGCRLRYDLRLDVDGARDSLRVEATDDGAVWNAIAEWSGSTSGQWVSMNEPLGSFDGEPRTHIRFRLLTSEGSRGAGADIDNVRIRCLSSQPSSRYSYYSGTSMASPHVAGAAALIWAALPSPTAAVVKDALLKGGDAKTNLVGKVRTGARLNVAGSLELLGVGAEASPPASPAASRSPQVVSPSPTASPSGGTATPPGSPSPSVAPSPSGASPTASPSPVPRDHDRSASLRLKGELVAKGRVTATDGYTACASGVPVKVFRNGKRIARTTTRSDGSYRVRLRARSGRYLAVAPSVTRAGGVERCTIATSHDGAGTMFRVNAEASTYDDACSIYSEAELDLVASLNGERAGAGVGELLLDGAISAVAQAHSEEMATTGTVSNVPVETLRERLADRDAVGQNVGSGSGVDALATAFMDSTTHRRTIVGMDYDRIGVGTTSYQGRTWVTLIFATASSADEGRSVDGCPPDIEETTR